MVEGSTLEGKKSCGAHSALPGVGLAQFFAALQRIDLESNYYISARGIAKFFSPT